MSTTAEAIKKQAEKPTNLIWIAVGFSVVYWILEAIRDVLAFNKGNIFERIFLPDAMTFWMRFLALCIMVMFGVYAQTLHSRIRNKEVTKNQNLRIILSGGGFALLYWVLESLRDTVLMDHVSFWDRLIVPDSMSLWMRLLAIFVIVLLSFHVRNLSSEQVRIDTALKKERDRLYTAVEDSVLEISKSNNYLRIENEELKASCEHAHHVIQTFKGLFMSTTALLKQTKLSETLNEVCNTLVNVSGFEMAWIGFRQGEEGNDVTWVAKAAKDAKYLALLDLEREEYELDKWPIGRALERGIPCIVDDMLDPLYATNWCNNAVKTGITKLICLPLNTSGRTIGTLNLFPSKSFEFDSNELDNLKGLADGLVYAIEKNRQANTKVSRKKHG